MYYNCAEDAYTARIEAWARTTQELHLLPCTTDMSHWRQKPRMFAPTPTGINSLLFASFVGLDGNAMTGADVLSQWQVDVATFPHVMLAVRVPLPLGMLMVRNGIMQVMILGSWRCARRLFLEWPEQRFFSTGTRARHPIALPRVRMLCKTLRPSQKSCDGQLTSSGLRRLPSWNPHKMMLHSSMVAGLVWSRTRHFSPS